MIDTLKNNDFQVIRELPQPNEFWEHFKGGTYFIIGVGKHTEQDKHYVFYEEVGNPEERHVRPLDMFMGTVYRGDSYVYRFVRIKGADNETR